jgi:hypothetical protein
MYTYRIESNENMIESLFFCKVACSQLMEYLYISIHIDIYIYIYIYLYPNISDLSHGWSNINEILGWVILVKECVLPRTAEHIWIFWFVVHVCGTMVPNRIRRREALFVDIPKLQKSGSPPANNRRTTIAEHPAPERIP